MIVQELAQAIEDQTSSTKFSLALTTANNNSALKQGASKIIVSPASVNRKIPTHVKHLTTDMADTACLACPR